MAKLKKLKKGEAEIFVRLDNKVLTVTLPPPLVDKLVAMQREMEAEDILEVLVKSAETMITTMHLMKNGKHITDRKGESVEVHRDEEKEAEEEKE